MTDNITLPRKVAELIENLMHHAYNDGVKQLKYRSSQTVEAEEALRTALAAPCLEVTVDPRLTPDEAAAISSALAAEQPKQEPVAWVWLKDGIPVNVFLSRGDADDPYWLDKGYSTAPLYTAPPDAEALRRDAERYRWMKQEVKRIPPSWYLFGWDASINAAMKGDKT